MSVIMSKHLEAAIIDQIVAGTFHGKVYAFTPVYEDGAWRLGVAVANESGYSPISGKSFRDQAEAKEWAAELNAHVGLTEEDAMDIVTSTMGGSRVAVVKQ